MSDANIGRLDSGECQGDWVAGKSRNTSDSCAWGMYHPAGASCKCTRPCQDKVLVISRDISVVSTAQRIVQRMKPQEHRLGGRIEGYAWRG